MKTRQILINMVELYNLKPLQKTCVLRFHHACSAVIEDYAHNKLTSLHTLLLFLYLALEQLYQDLA